MKKIRIMEILLDMNNADCNGTPAEYRLAMSDGNHIDGLTCRCGSGCAGYDCINGLKEGQEWNFSHLDSYLRGEGYYPCDPVAKRKE